MGWLEKLEKERATAVHIVSFSLTITCKEERATITLLL
jgi:hypothetical protein